MKNIPELVDELADAIRAKAEKNFSSLTDSLAGEVGSWKGLISFLPNTEENRKFLEIALATVAK